MQLTKEEAVTLRIILGTVDSGILKNLFEELYNYCNSIGITADDIIESQYYEDSRTNPRLLIEELKKNGKL